MLTREELIRESEHFGVAEAQIRRDHAISHVLAALSQSLGEDVIFFGGTALNRTYLDARLSEDIDLIAHADRAITIDTLRRSVDQELLRSHGRITWQPDFTGRDTDPAVLRTADGVTVRIQVLRELGYENWPTTITDINQRYADADPARLRVPTVKAFAGWKTTAWFDRRAARDLFDLWALAERDHLTPAAADLFVQHGPTHAPPAAFMFDKPPSEAEWRAQLAGQTRLTITAAHAINTVRDAWAAATDDPDHHAGPKHDR